jgi:hypothetical protein
MKDIFCFFFQLKRINSNTHNNDKLYLALFLKIIYGHNQLLLLF